MLPSPHSKLYNHNMNQKVKEYKTKKIQILEREGEIRLNIQNDANPNRNRCVVTQNDMFIFR